MKEVNEANFNELVTYLDKYLVYDKLLLSYTLRALLTLQNKDSSFKIEYPLTEDNEIKFFKEFSSYINVILADNFDMFFTEIKERYSRLLWDVLLALQFDKESTVDVLDKVITKYSIDCPTCYPFTDNRVMNIVTNLYSYVLKSTNFKQSDIFRFIKVFNNDISEVGFRVFVYRNV